MRVISLWQPWATLVVIGAKRIETRSWDTKYRGPLLIHAAKTDSHIKMICGQEYYRDFIADWRKVPYGAIIGKVMLTGTVQFGQTNNYSEQERAFGDYAWGRFGWMLENPQEFKNPIPAKGHQGFWKYDNEIKGYPELFVDNGKQRVIINN